MIDQIRERIKKEARKGDFVEVADLVNLKPDTVRKVISGRRQNSRVLEAFILLLDDRKTRKENYKIKTGFVFENYASND